jgi:glycyl-tRNA synthetase beta chain
MALLAEIEKRERAIADAIGTRRDYRTAYTEAAAFEPAVATFFKEVLVMAEDRRLREARLGLMKRLEHLILQLGDISEIVAAES